MSKNSQYLFEALDTMGQEVRGTVYAVDDQEACQQIRQKGLFVTRIDTPKISKKQKRKMVCEKPVAKPNLVFIVLVFVAGGVFGYGFAEYLRWCFAE